MIFSQYLESLERIFFFQLIDCCNHKEFFLSICRIRQTKVTGSKPPATCRFQQVKVEFVDSKPPRHRCLQTEVTGWRRLTLRTRPFSQHLNGREVCQGPFRLQQTKARSLCLLDGALAKQDPDSLGSDLHRKFPMPLGLVTLPDANATPAQSRSCHLHQRAVQPRVPHLFCLLLKLPHKSTLALNKLF